MRFEESAKMLADMVGRRNGELMGVAIRGLNEGLDPETVAKTIAESCGDPPLSSQEIERAVTRAKEFLLGNASIKWTSVAKILERAKAAREECTEEERQFVPAMIAAGRSFANSREFKDLGKALTATSPTTRQDVQAVGLRSDWLNTAALFVRTIYPDDDGYVFSTADIRAPRGRDRLCRPSELHDRIMRSTGNGVHGNWGLPSHCCPNLYTGTSKRINGKESFANKDVIKTRRLALVEFDAMSLDDQAAFWLGVVVGGKLRVRSIVYTRNKSLHGLVRVDEERPPEDLFGGTVGTVDRKVAENKWNNNWTMLHKWLCSNDDPTMRCDAACKDASRMTRFPGGLRETLNHTLCWLAKPNKTDDCINVRGKEWF